MNWYYVEQGQQAGPVSDEQLDGMLQSGQIQPETLIWREGMTAWQPYREVRGEPASSAGAGAPTEASPEAVCAECGRIFPIDETIRYGNARVCAACKPIFLQKLSEGIAQTAQRRGMLSEEELLARDYDVDLGSSIAKGWETFKTNAGIMIGASILIYLILAAINIIPYLSIILALFLTGPLTGGLWLLYVKLTRSESASLSDAFSGFGPRYWQFVLTTMVPTLLAMALMFIIGLVMAMVLPAFAHSRQSGGGPPDAFFFVFVILLLIIVPVFIYFGTCWRFALPLVADKKMRFWPALQLSRRMVSKHWWMTFALLLVCGLLAMLGIFACGIGLLVSGPVAFAAMAAHYDRVFGDLAPQD